MPGLHFYKLDLHVHTPASKCYQHKEHTAQDLVQAALDAELSAIAVTDHNTAEWIGAMQAAGEEAGMVIFPGVEISLNEGYHLVALFDPSAKQGDVENFLGALDITPANYGKPDTLCKKNVYEVIEKIHERGGLAILAHIDITKGAFDTLVSAKDDGAVRVPLTATTLFNSAAYDAVECVSGSYPTGFDQAHGIKRFPAYYQASDNPDPNDPVHHLKDGIGSRYSRFKLDEINLEGLRQCFADHEVRIQRMDEYLESHYPRVISMRIGANGFLRNQQFKFHEGLNSVIGGKGVGKSLAVELLRFGLGQVSPDASIRSDVNGKLAKCFGMNNTTEIVYQVSDGTQYKIVTTYMGDGRGGKAQDQCECVNLSTDTTYDGDLAQMFPVLAYSQTEVIKIAEDRSAQLNLIDRFIDSTSVKREIAAIREKLEASDNELVEGIIARDKLSELKKQIDTLQERIKNIDKIVKNPVFDEMKKAEAKGSLFDDKIDEIERLGSSIRDWINKQSAEKAHALPDEFAQDPQLAAVQKEVESAREGLLADLRERKLKLEGSRQAIEEALEAWLPDYVQITEKYKKVLEQVGGNREEQESERKRLVAQRDEYLREARQSERLVEQLPEVVKGRSKLLDDLEKAYFSFYEVRKAKFDQFTELSGGKLQLTLQHAANRKEYEDQLMDLLKGGANAPTTSDRRQVAEHIMPRRFVQLVLDRNVAHLANEAEISERTAEKVIEKLWSSDNFKDVLAVQHNCFPQDVPSIRFRKENGQYDELNELSVGQKCTALLIIALCDGNMPVVIDQPEDALDIISVWEDIAKKLRRGKNTRQFILTTHNSSVAVASDSDQFIVLKAGATQGKVVAAGAIDRPEVRKAVIEHLEGGDEPYKLRSRKYNIH